MTPSQILQVADRLQIAIDLAAASDQLRDFDPVAVKAKWRDLGQFFGDEHPSGSLGFGTKGPADVIAKAAGRQVEYQRERLAECQTVARTLLEQIVTAPPITVAVDARVKITAYPGKGAVRFDADTPNMFALALGQYLLDAAGARVKKCPECGRLFIRVRRQKYCQDSCTDRATWRNYPKAKKQKARKKQYAKNGWTVGARRTQRGKR